MLWSGWSRTSGSGRIITMIGSHSVGTVGSSGTSTEGVGTEGRGKGEGGAV